LKLVIGEHEISFTGDRNLKISFTLIPGFTALFIVAATKPRDQPSQEKWLYFVPCKDNPATQVRYVCPELFEGGSGYVILPKLFVTIEIQVQLIRSVLL